MRLRHVLFILFAFLISLSKTFAQVTTSEIQGVVQDDKGAGLQGATVVATHLPTGTSYSTTTRKDGRYNLPNLRIGGPYLITASFVGFGQEKEENVTLLLGQEFKADFSLKSQTQQLTELVISTNRQGKVFNSSHTGSQEIISRSQIERLPTVNRSLQDFTRLEPTASSTSFGQSFGGRSSQYNNVTVDGANFNNSFGLSGTLGGQTNSQPISLDAIEQIQVNVSPYDVRYGGFTGAGVNSVTRSGTNQVKASVYTYIKTPGSIGYNVDNVTVPRTDFNYNLRGFFIGAPIQKDKLFIFVSAEQVRQTQPATSLIASDASHAPSSSVSIANADTLNALRNFLIQKYGYDPGAFQGYSFNTKSDKITAKLDWNINKSNTLTLKYNYLKSSADQFASTSRPGSGQVTGGQPGTNSLPFYGSGYVINNNFNIVIAELNTRLSNSASNKIQVGYTALRDFRTPHSSSATFPLVDILFNNNIYTTFGYEPFTYNNTLNTDVYQLSDVFTYYKGSHELTIGTQDYYRKYQNAFAPGFNGGYQFNTLQDFYNSANNGIANSKNYYIQWSALPKGEFPWAYAGSTELGLFIQDKWRITNNFTLVYGIRADETIYKESFTDNPYFDVLTFANGTSYNIGKAPGTHPLISPRLGFNWDVKGDRTLQIRGGAGIFSGPPPFVWISNQASNNGIQFGSITYGAKAFKPDSTYIQSGPNSSYSVALVDKNFKYPTILKSNIAIDKKFGNNWVVTLEGSYSKDINAVYYSNINLNETKGFALAGADNRIRYLSVPNSNKYYYGNSLSNPNIGNAILMSNTGKGYAGTATVRVQKSFRLLDLSVAYTYSQAKNTAEGGSTASSLWSARAVTGDPNSPNLAYASYYQPHRVIATAAYRIEYAKYFATSIGAIFEAAPNGVTSYIYNGDVNGDGNSGNDLIYIPRSQSEINLVKSGSGGLGTGPSTDPRSATQIWNQLNNFINNDHYLAFHRGEYATANGVVYPFFKQLDLNITQDISLKTSKDRHTLRLSLDILNVGNLINRNWGLRKTFNLNNFLKYEGLAADGKTPSYSFTYLDPGNQIPLQNNWVNTTNINAATGASSRWQMQFGIRYLFN